MKKSAIVADAFAEVALAGFAADIEPDESQHALRRLESMLAVWESKGLRLGYAFEAEPAPDTETGLPAAAVEPVVLHLAKRIAASYGKALTPQQISTAREGYDALLSDAVRPQPQDLPGGIPLGSGNKWPQWRRYSPEPDTGPVRVADGGDEMRIP